MNYLEFLTLRQALIKEMEKSKLKDQSIPDIKKEGEGVMPISDKEYKMLEFNVPKKVMPHAVEDDYNSLIDIALDIRDFDWVKELMEKKEEHAKMVQGGYW